MATTPKKRLRIAAYIRVSTDRQADDGAGLETQEAAIRAWAKRSGHRIVKVCQDVMSGRTELADRDGLMCTLAAIESGEADGVVVYRLDRLARDLIIQEQLLAEAHRAGAQVFSTSDSESAVLVNDPDDPSRRLIRQVLGAVSEYERCMITLRMHAGRRRKAAAGGYAGGAPGYGLRASGGALVADQDEAAIVDRMRAMRASGASLRDICAALNDEGVSTKRGGRWSPSAVSRILDPAARERARQQAAVARSRRAPTARQAA